MGMMRVGKVAERLGSTRDAAGKYMDCGLCGPVETDTGWRLVSEAFVDALASRPPAVGLPAALIVRMGRKAPNSAGPLLRLWEGIDLNTMGLADQVAAMRGRWMLGAKEIAAALDTALIVAMVGEFPVLAVENLGVDEEVTDADETGRTTFRVRALPVTEPRAAAWLSARVPLGPGPETLIWRR